MTHPVRRGTGGGWTLIETLVAIALTAVLAAVVFSTWMTVHRVMKGRTARVSRAVASADALRRLAADLECACEPASGAALELKTDPKAAVAADLHFFSSPAGLPGSGGVSAEVTEMRYQVVRAEEWRQRLVRIERPVAGPGAMAAGVTNVLIGRAEAVTMEVFDGTNWLSAWPVTGGVPLPRAARASIVCSGAAGPATSRVETVIQAGVPVKPRIERRVTPAAAP